MGISMLGFSEHIPNPNLILPDEDHRMLLSEVDGYIASINKMKQDNPDMTILVGFEAEFDPMKEAFLGEMRDKETIGEGVTASMTGHLVYGTLHSNGVADAIRRMVNVFDSAEKNARAIDILTSLKILKTNIQTLFEEE